MTCIKIITHLTDKKIQVVNMNNIIINESSTNSCIEVPYDSYIIYMSNPIEITNITNLLSSMDNIFIQFFLFVLIIIIGMVFYIFLQIIKNKGFKGVSK